MKTRFSPIVKLKHSKMQKSEMLVQETLTRVQKAKEELERSLAGLDELQEPTSGSMQDFLVARTLVDAQMRLIEKNRQWVSYEELQLKASQEQLKADMIEYEKFKYLEAQEIQKLKKQQQIAEMKQLDEVAIMRYKQKEAI